MRSQTFHRRLKEVNQDGLEYLRWHAGKLLQNRKENLSDLEELQRFADFGRISAHFLHEFANPLTAASLHLQLCDSNSHEALKEVRKNIILLEKYMKAARSQIKQRSCRSSFIVQREVRRSLLLLAPLAIKAGVKLKVTALPQTLTMQGDAVKFNQIFANLVANAIDAYAEIDMPAKEKIVSVNYRLKGRFIHIYVHDNGKGISAEALPNLFKPFYSTKQGLGRGLGLGLALVKKTVQEDFNGYIYATSSKNNGTTFSVKLMLTKPPLIGAMQNQNVQRSLKQA